MEEFCMFINSRINIDKRLWKEILTDSYITTQKVKEILVYIVKQPKQEASGKEIAKVLNYKHHAPLNQIIPKFSKRILDKYSFVKKPTREDGTKRFWHIPFLGKEEKDKFLWILRPELKDALVELYNFEIEDYYFPEEITKNEKLIIEGRMIEITINAYERDKNAREICLNKHGYKCCICGFDFEEKYGPIGKGKIHVHHIVPISEHKKEYILNPETDLIPVCPNCHFMIHSKQTPFSIDEMKEIIENANM
jgi:5-methylcytosine-specific restriction protein A